MKPVKCPACDGLGFNAEIPKERDPKQECPGCNATGLVWTGEPVPVNIPTPFFVEPWRYPGPTRTWTISATSAEDFAEALRNETLAEDLRKAAAGVPGVH